MTETSVPKVKEIKPKAPTVKDLATKVEELVKNVSDLTDVVSSLVEKKQEEPKTTQPNGAPVASVPSQFPIPVEYREIVDSVLNKKFGVEIKYDSPGNFEFAVLVPEEYSNAGKNHWETYREDRRSRVVENALGSNGVRQWVELIYNNFNPETKSKIVFDRAQP